MGHLLAACDSGSEHRPVSLPPPAQLTQTAPPAPAPKPVEPVKPPPPDALLAADRIAASWEAAPRRALPAPSERARGLQELATRLGAPGSPVENPCVAPAGLGCARTALDPFFASLDALAAGSTSTPTVVEAFGNSLIAGDRIVDIIREDLAASFGNAGRGMLLVDRMAPYGGRSRTGIARDGWEPRTLGELRRPPHAFGITGVYHVSTRARATSRFPLDGERRGTLWWLDVPRGGRLTVSSGGKVLARTEPTGSREARALPFEIPEGAKSFDVTAEREGAVVHGVELQHERPGIVLDMLGVPSADAYLFLRTSEDLLKAQLAARSPRLMLFFLGGNEAKRLEWKRSTPERLRKDLAAFLSRARAAAPDSACLVIGPIDAVQDRNEKGTRLSQRPYLEAVIDAEREVAFAHGCAFFNHFAAMGGEGSLRRFYKAGLIHEDLVHPRGQGLDLLGQLAVDALLRAWVHTPPAADGAALTTAWDTLRGPKAAPAEGPAPARTPHLAVIAPDSHAAREGLQAGLAAAGALGTAEQVEQLLLASAGPLDEALAQALARARAAHPKAECLWLPLGAPAPAPEGCRALELKLDAPAWRENLAAQGWVDGSAGGWTRRGGLGTAALVLASLERERGPRAPPPLTTSEDVK
jgi:lysophospholipase L1-like esterase